MQVDPNNLTVKAPGNKRSKLKCDEVLSNFAFKFNLRRYNKGEMVKVDIPTDFHFNTYAVGAYTRPPLSSTALCMG